LFAEATLYRYRAGIPGRESPKRFVDWKNIYVPEFAPSVWWHAAIPISSPSVAAIRDRRPISPLTRAFTSLYSNVECRVAAMPIVTASVPAAFVSTVALACVKTG
jgi:hypothetical protein